MDFDRFGDRVLVVLTDDAAADPEGLYARALAHLELPAIDPPDGLGEVRFSNRPDGADGIAPDDRRRLYELFAAEIDELEAMTGRDLTAWRTG